MSMHLEGNYACAVGTQNNLFFCLPLPVVEMEDVTVKSEAGSKAKAKNLAATAKEINLRKKKGVRGRKLMQFLKLQWGVTDIMSAPSLR